MPTHITFNERRMGLSVKEDPDEVQRAWTEARRDHLPHIWLTRNNNGKEIWVNYDNILFIEALT